MIQLTDNARKELDSFFADKKKDAIRIYLSAGWGGPRLALALDEPNDQDSTEEQAGYTFCMSKTLLDEVKGVTVDLTYMGFTITPEVPFASSGDGGCSSCTSCGDH